MKRKSMSALLGIIGIASLAACGQGGESENAQIERSTIGSASGSGGGAANSGKTIGDTLAQSAEHSTLNSAFKAAGLSETMAGAGPYTLFAPTNAAFQKLPAGTAEGLMQPQSKAALTGLLTHHVVPGVVTAKDLAAAIERGGGKAELATMHGGTLTAAQADGRITISDGNKNVAQVTQADMIQSNGVVHAVDAVLMPQ